MPRPTTRTVLYRGRKRDLIRVVDRLCALKKRPVCSTDIQDYLSSQPETEVGYIQALGQILIKAAIPRPAPIPVLHRVGIHRNKTYYTVDANPEWNLAFEQFCAFERAEFPIKRGFLTCFSKEESQDPLECAASAHLRQIIEATLPLLTSPFLTFQLRTWLDLHPSRPAGIPAHERISRCVARKILQAETARRIPWVSSMNYQRHLARVSPTILRPNRAPSYSEELLHAYCRAQWPVAEENAEKQTTSLLWWTLAMQGLSNCSGD